MKEKINNNLVISQPQKSVSPQNNNTKKIFVKYKIKNLKTVFQAADSKVTAKNFLPLCLKF
jgi:hypothetical protein